MTLAINIVALLIIIAPVLVYIWQKHLSEKAQAKKRRKKEDQAAHAKRVDAQESNRQDADVHDRQEEAEKKWRKSKKEP